MGIPFIPLCAIIAVLIIAFLFASLPQISHKTRYRVLYAITIIMLLAVIPIKQKNQALENALTEKQQENISILLEHQNEKQRDLQQKELEWFAGKIKMFTEEEQKAIIHCCH